MSLIDKKILERLKAGNLTYAEGKKITTTAPEKMLIKFYANFADRAQVRDLLNEWARFRADPSDHPDIEKEGPEAISARCDRMGRALIKALKRKRVPMLPHNFET